MICPHCSASLKQKERPGHRCGRCRREFALDPKDNPLLLHDIRLRQLAEKLSDGGRLRYTMRQLWYGAARKTARSDASPLRTPGLLAGVAIAVVLIGVGLAADVNGLVVIGCIVGLVAAGNVVVRGTGLTGRRVAVRMTLPKFRWQVIPRWERLYGGFPPGLVDEDQVRVAPPPPRPALAVLCRDASVRAFLEINGVPQRLGAALVQAPEQVPPGVPAVLLHDASVPGYRFAAHARTVLAGRPVLDPSPRPSQLAKAKGALKLREAPPPEAELAALRATRLLTEPDLEWLAKGWWSPIAAVRPAALLARIDAAAGRTDPDRRAASAVGFLTWPRA